MKSMTTPEIKPSLELGASTGSALSLWERLKVYQRQMAPHVAAREGGQLIAAAADEIARLMIIEASAMRDGCGDSLGSVVRFQLEGQRKQDPRRWDEIAPAQADEESARAEEAGYRDYMANEKTGWLDFRVVRVTTTREVLPNDKFRHAGPVTNDHEKRTNN